MKLNPNHAIVFGVASMIVGIGFFIKSIHNISQGHSTTLMAFTDYPVQHGVYFQFGISLFVIIVGIMLISDSYKTKKKREEQS